jgi:hypothetical protein
MDAGFFKASLDIATKITQSRNRTITDAGFFKASLDKNKKITQSRNHVIALSRMRNS